MSDHDIFPTTAARLAQWRAQPDVLGVVLVGSKSRGHADELSDDDLEVLLTDEAFLQRKPTECHELAFQGENTGRTLIYDAQYTTLSDLQRKATSTRDVDHWPYERARVLFDRNGDVTAAVERAGKMDAAFRHTRLLHATIDAWTAPRRADKTFKRGNQCAGKLLVVRGVRALTRLLFALEWRWVPLDHWLEAELQTLDDPTNVGALLCEAMTSSSIKPLQQALDSLEDRLTDEGVPSADGRYHLFLELIHPTRADEHAVHGL